MKINSIFLSLTVIILFINCDFYKISDQNINNSSSINKTSSGINENSTSRDNYLVQDERKQNDMIVTQKVNLILNKIEAAILEKEGKIIKPIINNKPEFDNQFPERNVYYQGDIILTEEQAKELIDCAIKEAARKGVDVSKIDINIDDKKPEKNLDKLKN
ncbi:Hypothetical protein SRAE_2000453000 [Strongyloides ratti]|uniref:Lipoprotein n=1 Tax=Strongyloides ratti TaxID=34506 RepID=A0A090LNW7_STRRB|nr:Hypothetical protein SRAE_2000453000 [Strongyloides ratti]CEF69884.1 Hypothetical protein SRAE_2000453000 [Strongyloides ratti]